MTEIRCVDGTGTELATRLTEDKVRQSAFSILNSNTVCSIATVTPEGRSHINAAYFSYSAEYEVFYLSSPSSVHSRNLSGNSSMAVTVFSSTPAWGSPSVGIQLFGSADEPSGIPADTAERSYGMRFPDFVKWKAMVGADVAHQYKFYRCLVDSLKILDERNFGDSVWVCASILRK